METTETCRPGLQPTVGPTQADDKPCSHLYCHDRETKSEKGSGLKITHPRSRQTDGPGRGWSHRLVHRACWPPAALPRCRRGQGAGASSRHRLTWRGCLEKYETNYGFRALSSLAERCWSRSILGTSRTTV